MPVFSGSINKFMNVLILTPDAVGSTLLQRLITIYMNFHQFNKPVINLHELTNGLVKYHSKEFDSEVLGKPEVNWGYYQTLKEIVELLDSVNHYKTSRLAHYHILNRGDSIQDQIPFYQYLNENFYVISCRRHNLFEHALSWALSKVTKKLNVYESEEKVCSFFHLYKNGIELDPNSIVQTLENYKRYIEWCNNHFNVASYFYYEEHLPKVEKYILSLPIFSQQTEQITWADQFGLEFNDWNKCHYLKSDIGTLALSHQDKLKELEPSFLLTHNAYSDFEKERNFIKSYNGVRDSLWPDIESIAEFNQLPMHIQNEVTNVFKITVPAEPNRNSQALTVPTLSKILPQVLPDKHREFLNAYQIQYNQANDKINELTRSKILIGAPPIKKQTLAEKRYMIKNFNHCLEVFNQWVEHNPNLGSPVSYDVIDEFATQEQKNWEPTDLITESK